MRLATHEDIPQIVEMSRAYYDKMQPVWPYSPEGVERVIATLIDSPDGLVLVGDGFFAGVKQANPLSPDWTIASEVMWWSDRRGAGARLFRAFRKWAQDADEIRYSCPPDQTKVAAFFERFGRATEIIFSEV